MREIRFTGVTQNKCYSSENLYEVSEFRSKKKTCDYVRKCLSGISNKVAVIV